MSKTPLKNKDFRRENLEGEDFSHQDIRGVDFSHANLTGAKFIHAKAGLSPIWSNTLTTLTLILAFLAGLTSAYGGALIAHLFTRNPEQLSLFSFLSVAIFITFLLITLWRGWGTTLTTLAEIVTVALFLATLFITIIAFSPENESGWNVAMGAEFTILGLIGAIAGIVDLAMAIALSKSYSFPTHPY